MRTLERRYRFLVILTAVVGVFPRASLGIAEVYHCEGKWTNVPCSERTKPVKDLPGLSRYVSPAERYNPIEDSPGDASDSYEQRTRLRMVGNPVGRWVRSGSRVKLEGADVTIKNAGSTTAQDIQVLVTVPETNATYPLDGPTTLDRNKTGRYSNSNIKSYATAQSNLIAEITCSNCRDK